jgi:hypothetical protein
LLANSRCWYFSFSTILLFHWNHGLMHYHAEKFSFFLPFSYRMAANIPLASRNNHSSSFDHLWLSIEIFHAIQTLPRPSKNHHRISVLKGIVLLLLDRASSAENHQAHQDWTFFHHWTQPVKTFLQPFCTRLNPCFFMVLSQLWFLL